MHAGSDRVGDVQLNPVGPVELVLSARIIVQAKPYLVAARGLAEESRFVARNEVAVDEAGRPDRDRGRTAVCSKSPPKALTVYSNPK